jgi:hypothetical protein
MVKVNNLAKIFYLNRGPFNYYQGISNVEVKLRHSAVLCSIFDILF